MRSVLAGGRADGRCHFGIGHHGTRRATARAQFAPGEEHLYCNTGYTLLAVVVKRVSGKSLKEFCDERMFQPLGMTHTHFHDDHRQIVPSRAYSYSGNSKDGYQNSVLFDANAGAASLFRTRVSFRGWNYNRLESRAALFIWIGVLLAGKGAYPQSCTPQLHGFRI